MIQSWPSLGSQAIGDYHVFRLRLDRKRSPRTGREHDFFVIDSADWVNVVALTPDNQVVMVEQFRHGTQTVELEIPGGVMDPGDVSPITAGIRELREETGYEGEQAQVIGQVSPNPAIMTNTCYTVCVQRCALKYDTAFDHGEDLVTRLVPVSDLSRLVADGVIRHSLVVAAIYHFELWPQRKPLAPRLRQ